MGAQVAYFPGFVAEGHPRVVVKPVVSMPNASVDVVELGAQRPPKARGEEVVWEGDGSRDAASAVIHMYI